MTASRSQRRRRCFALISIPHVLSAFSTPSRTIGAPFRGLRVAGLRTRAFASRRLPATFDSVEIWDGVVSPDGCEILDEYASEHNERTESSIFYRTPSSPSASLSPLERCLDEILNSVEGRGEDQAVEYWSRQIHLNIDLHSDVDEETFVDDNVLRFPSKAHVLYLDVEGEEWKGPTVVLPSKGGGWGGGNGTESVDVVVVPAVKGRLLRFNGDAMHGVPCPVTGYLDLGGEAVDDIDPDGIADTEDGRFSVDYYADDEDEQVRFVLLFNTWPKINGPPPRGVDLDFISGGLPSGIELEGEEDHDEFDDEYDTEEEEEVRPNPLADWKPVSILNSQNQSSSLPQMEPDHVRLPFLGNSLRRGNESPSVRLKTSLGGQLRAALVEKKDVTAIVLEA